ncbi:MAG: hypothetical protein ACPGUD_12190 [Parashewanella sp.]
MPYLTGRFTDGSEMKKLITSKTKEIKLSLIESRAEKRLESVDLSELHIATNLEYLSSGFSLHITQQNLDDIAKCSNLKSLTLSTPERLNFSCLAKTKIEKMWLWGAEINIDSFSDLDSLEELSISTAHDEDIDLQKLPRNLYYLRLSLSQLQLNLSQIGLPKLTSLILENLPPQQIDIPEKIASNLATLALRNCANIGTFMSDSFRHNRKLRFLNLEGSNWENLHVDYFCTMPTLKRVLMTDTCGIYADLKSKSNPNGTVKFANKNAFKQFKDSIGY